MRLVPLVLLLITASLAAAPVPKAIKKKFPDYYPLTAGAEWVYQWGKNEMVEKVSEFEEKGGVKTAKTICEIRGKVVSTDTVRVDKGGVFCTHINGKEVEPELPLLKFGLTEEEGWEMKSSFQQSRITGRFTLKGVEKVTVPAGQYDTVVIEGNRSEGAIESKTKRWYADGVGVVKMEYTMTGGQLQTVELKKYTPGEQPKSK